MLTKIMDELLDYLKSLEIGYSGKAYDFLSIIEALLSQGPTDYRIHSQDFSYEQLSPKMVRLIYLSAQVDGNGVLSRHA